MEIFGYTGSAARDPAVKLGLAMQLTNTIIRNSEITWYKNFRLSGLK